MTVFTGIGYLGSPESAAALVGDSLRAEALEREIEALAAGTGITPELLLATCQVRLRDLDGQVQDCMAAMNERSALATAMSERLTILRTAMSALERADGYGTDGTVGGTTVVPVQFPGMDHPENWNVNQIATYLTAHGFSEPDATSIGTRAGLQTLIDRANDELREINSGNELLMIKLQSTMQARTSIITATTNLLKTLDEGNDAVVANLR